MPETITIKFEAKDEGLVNKINELANAQAKYNKSVKASEQSSNKEIKSLQEKNKELFNIAHKQRVAIQNSRDAARFKELETAANERWASVKRSNKKVFNDEQKSRQKTLKLLKEDIVARSKIVRQFKKIDSGLTKMTVSIKQHGLSWKKLGIDVNTVKRAYKGNKASIEQMRMAMKKANKEGLLSVRNNRLLSNSFATLRSKMLLFSFAMGMGVRQLGKFAGEAGKVQDMERAFNNLSGGAENASIAVDKLKLATNETMSEFDLFQQANNAMILGVSKNSDQMAHMFDVAQRLGAALGKDTKSSVESLITGIGRQSRMMLDNIGIIVKSDEAYKKYADRLGISVDQLTDNQRKQAFLTATMDAAELKLKSVGKEVISYNAKMQIAGARMANMRVEIGKKLLPVLSTLAKHFTDTATIKGYGLAILGVTTGLVYYKRTAVMAAIATDGLKVAFQRFMAATLIGVVIVALGELASRFLFSSKAAEGLVGSMKMLNSEYLFIAPPAKIFSDQVEKQIALSTAQSNAFSMLLDPFKALRKMYSQTTEGQIEMLDLNISLIESMGGFTEKNKELSAVYDMLLKQREEFNLTAKEEVALINKHAAAENRITKLVRDKAIALMELNDVSAQDIDLQKNRLKFMGEQEKIDSKILKLKKDFKTANDSEQKAIALIIASLKDEKEQYVNLERVYQAIINKKYEIIKANEHEAKTSKLISALQAEVSVKQELVLAQMELSGASENAIALREHEFNFVNRLGKANSELADLKAELNSENILDIVATTALIAAKEGEIENLKALDFALRAIIDSQNELRTMNEIMAGLDSEFNIFPELDPQLFQTLDKWVFQNHDALLKRNELTQQANDEYEALKESGHMSEQEAEEVHQQRLDMINAQYNMARLAKLNENLQMVQGMANNLTAGLKADLDQRINNELNALKDSHRYQNASSERREDMENSVRRKYAAEQLKIFKMEQKAKLADVVFNTSSAVMKSYSASPLTFGLPWSALAIAQGMMQAQQINSATPPSYQYGGLIGGNRHAQGGTTIEAERGEFVMQRRAVQSLGVETMNRINEGGGGGSNVTVNVSGNILTSDYVEGELADAIREASRRGTDFGVS